MQTDKDHTHILLKSEPKYSAHAIVRRLKQETTYKMWKTQSAYLRRYFWSEHTLWGDGYFVCTIGNISKETATKYIKNQG